MAYIAEWVSQIVFFIFLATIISLLIPTNSHEKVIKLVFGLVIFLLFLQPIIKLFNLNPDEIAQSLDYANDSFFDLNIDGEISQKKNDIQAQHNAYILEQLETQILNLIAEELIENHDVIVNDISIKLPDGEIAQETYELESITVYISRNESGTNDIEEINEVTIPAQQRETKNIGQEDEEEIITLIAEKLDISPELIIIVWEGA